jgi:sec-independent protein translocase protein TatC
LGYDGPLSQTTEQNVENAAPEEQGMTILEHLDELRKRLIWIVVSVAVMTIISIVIVSNSFDILLRPKPANVEVIYIGVTEMFTTYMKVALFTGIVLAMPIIVYQLGAFVMPGMTSREKRYLYMLVPGVFGAFIVGVVFAYFIVVPFAIRYLLTTEFLTNIALPMIRISDYIEFVVNLLLAIGLAFELPIVVFFLTRIGLVSTQKLVRYRKYAILGSSCAGCDHNANARSRHADACGYSIVPSV